MLVAGLTKKSETRYTACTRKVAYVWISMASYMGAEAALGLQDKH